MSCTLGYRGYRRALCSVRVITLKASTSVIAIHAKEYILHDSRGRGRAEAKYREVEADWPRPCVALIQYQPRRLHIPEYVFYRGIYTLCLNK